MSTTTKTVKTAEEKLAAKDTRIRQLQKQKQAIIKRENAKERKVRNHRLCRRHGLFEKLMPDIINITYEQYEAFIRTHIRAKHGRNKLAEIVEKGEEYSAAYIAKCRNEEEVSDNAEPSETQHNNGTDGNTNSPQAVSSGA